MHQRQLASTAYFRTAWSPWIVGSAPAEAERTPKNKQMVPINYAHAPILEGERPFLASLTMRSTTSSAEKLFFTQDGAERM